MPDGDQTIQPGGTSTEELEDRIAKLVKSTVAGHIGSLREDIGSVRELLDKQESDRRKDLVAKMSPEQAKEYAIKTVDAEPQGRPKVDQYFRKQAEALLEDAGVQMEIPTWETGKPVGFYEEAYGQFRRKVFDAVAEKNKSEAVKIAEAKVREILAEKGLDVVDTGSGVSTSVPGKVTRQQLRDMSPEEYAKVRDSMFSK